MDWLIQWAGNGLMDLLSNSLDFLPGLGDLNVQESSSSWLGEAADSFNEFVKISPLTNDHVLGLSDYLMNFGIKHATTMTGVGRALGAVFAVIVAGKEAYKVMAEQRGFDILDILRPILFAFVLAFWGPIVNTVIAPGHAVETHCKNLYLISSHRVDSLSQLQMNNTMKLGSNIRKQQAAVRQQESAEKGGGFSLNPIDAIKAGWDKIEEFFSSIYVTAVATTQTFIQHFFQRIFMWFGEVAFTVAIYIVFVLKALFITVLAMFGPVYMAASILPAWKEAWKQWLERIVNASFYGAMGYLAMAFSMQLICYSLEMDINALDGIVKGENGLLTYLAGNIGTTCNTIITYFVGCFAMKAVPEMASMCFPGSASMAASTFIGGMGGKAMAATVGLAKMAATKGKA